MQFLFGEYCLFTKEGWHKNGVQGLNINPCTALQSLLSREKGGADPFLIRRGQLLGRG